jgi:RNA exonuclease 4
VNNEGNVVLDTHVAAKETVVDYRTRFSGIRPADLKGAPAFEQVGGAALRWVRRALRA